MNRLCIAICIFILTLSASAYAGKPGTGCGEIPTSWTFMATTAAPAGILSDDPTKSYVNGVDGITNSVIQYGGTYDATIGFTNKSKRAFRYTIPLVIPGSIIQAGPVPFADGNSFLSQGTLNIRNIIGHPIFRVGSAASFYTKASGRFKGTDGKEYRWGSVPDDFTCPAGGTCVPDMHVPLPAVYNDPVQTGWVKVTYSPRNPAEPWSTTNTDTWLVEGEFTSDSDPNVQRVTLNLVQNISTIHSGQYSLPFRILIKALAAINC